MTTTLEMFKSALAHHRAGQLDESERVCQQILSREPENAHVLHLLGAVQYQRGKHAEAVEYLSRATTLDKNQVAFHSTLAAAQLALGRIDDAMRSMREVLRLRPDHTKTRNDLGVLLANTGQLDEAAECFRKVLAHGEYGPAHNNLGNILQQSGQVAEAIECFRAAIRAAPRLVQAYNNLANALKSQGKIDEAIAQYRAALVIAPDYAEGEYNLGLALQGLGQLDEARRHFARAVELRPNDATFQVGLGGLLLDDGLLDDALACLDDALRADPEFAPAQYFRGTIRLARGQFASGWADYEARLRCPNFMVQKLPQPQWTGEPLAGRTLLIHCEQGLGDTLQFIRYVKQVARDDGQVVIAAQERLLPLLVSSGFTSLASAAEPPPAYDLQVPLMSLPRIFGTDLQSIPHDVPYLQAEPERIERWKVRLNQHEGFKVGIVWQGRPSARADRMRSIPLACFEPLAAAGARLVSLQKGPGSEQLAELAGRFEVVDLAGELDNQGGAFMDTAAVMKNLDLVVSSDTAPAHLAGALGVPVWVALSLAPEWRWMLDRDDSPWYPSMRLFRQRQERDWSSVFQTVAQELSREIERFTARAVS